MNEIKKGLNIITKAIENKTNDEKDKIVEKLTNVQ